MLPQGLWALSGHMFFCLPELGVRSAPSYGSVSCYCLGVRTGVGFLLVVLGPSQCRSI